jgi:hypothetical protein
MKGMFTTMNEGNAPYVVVGVYNMRMNETLRALKRRTPRDVLACWRAAWRLWCVVWNARV